MKTRAPVPMDTHLTLSGPIDGPANVDPGDAALLARLRAGEDQAYDELILLVGGRFLSVARRMLWNEEDAHDAVQEAFLCAFRSLDRFDGRSRIATWLHSIVVNACRMKLRSKKRRPEAQIEDMLPVFLDDGHQAVPARAWKPEPASGIEQQEILTLVREKIDELPEAYRTVLILRDIEELDTEATSVVLGISPNAVKVRLHRARQALRGLLDAFLAEG